MTTQHTGLCRDGGGPASDCLRRYATPPAPPFRRGLTARQSGELERIAARYGALVWRLRDDGTVAVAVLGDHPDPCDEVLLKLLHADGTLLWLCHWAPPRNELVSAPQSGEQEPPHETNRRSAQPHLSGWCPADHADVPPTAHV
jgi:hypothetical protein